MLPDGTGFEIVHAGNGRKARVCGERPCEAVDLFFAGEGGWTKSKTYAIKDDTARGVITTPDGDILYNPDTGASRK